MILELTAQILVRPLRPLYPTWPETRTWASRSRTTDAWTNFGVTKQDRVQSTGRPPASHVCGGGSANSGSDGRCKTGAIPRTDNICTGSIRALNEHTGYTSTRACAIRCVSFQVVLHNINKGCFSRCSLGRRRTSSSACCATDDRRPPHAESNSRLYVLACPSHSPSPRGPCTWTPRRRRRVGGSRHGAL